MSFLQLAAAVASIYAGQIMGGPAFERFATQADRSCPTRHLRSITPGDLSWEQETFEAQLTPPQQRRLAMTNRSNVRCAGREGLSCPTSEMLDAMARVKMLHAFGAFTCSHLQP